MATNKQDVLRLLHYAGYAYPLIIFILTAIASFFDPVFIPFSAFFFLLWYDMGGYEFVLIRRELGQKGWLPKAPATAEATYRFTSFWIGLVIVGSFTLICWGFYGYWNAVFVPGIFFVLFLTGNKETQYYLFFHDPLAPVWEWSEWTIAGKLYKGFPTAKQMKGQMIIGDVVAILTAIVWRVFLNYNWIEKLYDLIAGRK